MTHYPDGDDTASRPVAALRERALASLAILGLVFALQWLSGAWSSDLGADSDEPAHYVTGLMLRQYLLSGFSPPSPLAFARDYYAHYPKVALGHFPPAYYIAEGAWMLVFGPNRVSVLLFMGCLGALFSLLTFHLLRSRFGFIESLTGALLCAALPVVQQSSGMVMSDLLLAVFCLGAALAFSRYLVSGRPRHSFAFGVLASLAIMTKGSGMLLVFFVPLALIFSAKFSLLRRPSLWLAPLPVLVICLPWLALTYHITEEGMAREPMLPYLVRAGAYFAGASIHTFGYTLLFPALGGVCALVCSALADRKGIEPFWASMLALPPSLITLYSLVPGGLDPRYLIPAAPPLLALWLLGLRVIHEGIAPKMPALSPRLSSAALPLVLVPFFLWETFRVPEKRITGYRAAAEFVARHVEAETAAGDSIEVLISSDARGEGAFIAELAMLEPAPRIRIHRSSKILSSSDWVGREYATDFSSLRQMREFLESSGIDWIITDDSIPPRDRRPHHTLLEESLRKNRGPLTLATEHAVERRVSNQSLSGALRCYRRETVPEVP